MYPVWGFFQILPGATLLWRSSPHTSNFLSHGSIQKVSAALARDQTQKKELTLPTPTITDRLEANPVETGGACRLCQNTQKTSTTKSFHFRTCQDTIAHLED